VGVLMRGRLAAWVPACALAGVLGVGAAGAPATSARGPGTAVRAAEQPQLRAIAAPAAWRLSRGQGVTVGVLDTGADAGVPDLAGSVRTGPDYTRGADPAGYQPPHLHGTFIASLIAGHGSGPGRAGGVIGIAPRAKVLSVRVILDDQEPGFAVYNESATYTDAIAKGIRYAVRHGAGVINLSLGGSSPARTTRAAITYAISRGVVVVAAAGNNGTSAYSYPAAYTGVISVAAATARGSRASFSERNSSVLVAAPGVGILGAGPHGTYLRGSGTSPASAFVAGVAALIRAKYPRLSPALVTRAIVTSTTHRPAGGYRPATGFGEVNAVAAVRAAGRLAAARAITGTPPRARFGRGPGGPVQVVRHDTAGIAVYGAVAAVAALGFLAALTAAGRGARRGRRKRHGRAAGPVPGGWPAPGSPGGGPTEFARGGGPAELPPGGGPARGGSSAPSPWDDD